MTKKSSVRLFQILIFVKFPIKIIKPILKLTNILIYKLKVYHFFKEVEREISFRTEQGLYYSFYKQILQAPNLRVGKLIKL